MIIVGYGGGNRQHGDAGRLVAAAHSRGSDPFFGPRWGAAPYLLVSPGHGSLAPDTWNAAHHPSMVSGLSWPAADSGAGVPAVKVASLHRVWAQEVLTKVQDRASGQVLQSLLSLSGNMEPR